MVYSCFLSLLLIAAALWKIKHKYDSYRRRQVRVHCCVAVVYFIDFFVWFFGLRVGLWEQPMDYQSMYGCPSEIIIYLFSVVHLLDRLGLDLLAKKC